MKTRTVVAALTAAITLGLMIELVEAQYGGSRRRARRRTAVVVSSASNAETAQAEQEAAAANARADSSAAAAAAAQAENDSLKQAAAAQPAGSSGALPIGSVVDALPEGCTKQVIQNVEYYFDGKNYYRAAFQGSKLVYVTAQPDGK